MFNNFSNFTEHMRMRMRQRGKPEEGIRMVLRYGRRRAKGGDGLMLRKKDVEREIERRKRWLGRIDAKKRFLLKAMRRRIRHLERMRGCVVVERSGAVITVYNRVRRFRRRR